ncbi:MAG TPA: hypothetical protein VFM81_09245 [Actinomycetota bacterium]|nr:hypothetical protein [Actinomycetota bacterium]
MSVNRGAEARQPASFPAEFERIEAAVVAGESDLRALGFWRLLARVKTDQVLAAHWAEQAGRIDRRAFESGVRFRLPVWFGNLVLVLGIAAGGVAVAVALTTDSPELAAWALVFAALDWSASFHAPAHWLVGRFVGMRFLAYFVHDLIPPVPGLKIDYETYLRTPPQARAWMHASGAIASKVGPFLALVFWPASGAPAWAAWLILGYGLLILATDVFISTRKSDWKRFRREMRVARIQAAAR